jgi:hypothetical protein
VRQCNGDRYLRTRNAISPIALPVKDTLTNAQQLPVRC